MAERKAKKSDELDDLGVNRRVIYGSTVNRSELEIGFGKSHCQVAYSVRNAFIGSTLAARRAGIQHAVIATLSRSTPTTSKLAISTTCMP